LTTSQGIIVEFDRHGLRRHTSPKDSKWEQSLLVESLPESWHDYWDEVLAEVCLLSLPLNPSWEIHKQNPKAKLNGFTWQTGWLAEKAMTEIFPAAQIS